MSDDAINDLKQFIATALAQGFSNVATKEDLAKLETRFDGLEVRFDELEGKVVSLQGRVIGVEGRVVGLHDRFDALEDKVDGIQTFLESSTMPYIQEVDNQVQGHEKRIVKLERKAA